jgi:N-acetylmuramoyl-L-alanine amidase/murein DD-endopeptidase MepM/ murein hydrolase activator NlpD/peptidoglycan hydrolase-like protein with peptidoglycan-binding domain
MSNKPIIVIDPGHGGKEKVGGSSPNNAVGANGLLEKNLTLDVANRIVKSLANQADVFMTRAGDTNLGLAARAKVAKDKNASLFLSIHFNGFSDTAVDGTEVWVAKNANSTSRSFAKTLLEKVLDATKIKNRGVREGDLGVLLPSRHSSVTSACLLEVSFLSNPTQARELESDTYKQKIANSIISAVREYFSLTATAHSLFYDRQVAMSLGKTKKTLDEIAQEMGYGSKNDYVSKELKSATLFGLSVGGGLHPDFYKKLQAAETKAKAMITPTPTTAADWGVKIISGYQADKKGGYHPWGLAIDIDYAENPYIMHEEGEADLDKLLEKVYQRIARFMLKRNSVIPKDMFAGKKSVGDMYDLLKEESDAMKTYFKIMQNQSSLQAELNKHDLFEPKFWEEVWGVKDQTPSLDWIQEIMMRDYVILAGEDGPAISGKTYPSRKDVLKGISGDVPFDDKKDALKTRKPENGFLTIRKELVLALTGEGLRWGAMDFGSASGDVMHFDDGKKGSLALKIAAIKNAPAKAKGQSFDYSDDFYSSPYSFDSRSFDVPTTDIDKPVVSRKFSELKDPPENHYEVEVSSVGKIKVTEGFIVIDTAHSLKKGIKAIMGDGTYKTFDDVRANLGLDYVILDKDKEVKNWFNGEVYKTQISDKGYGNKVVVKTFLKYKFKDKEYPVFTHYAHLKEINSLLKKGNPIKAGEFIGVMGNTGHSKGAHVDQRFWIETNDGIVDISPNLLVNVQISETKSAYSLGGPSLGEKDVKWSGDNLSPDYSHLNEAISKTSFEFTADKLSMLCEVNSFKVDTSEKTPRDEVLFALRGCVLADGKESSGGFVDKINLVEAVPDHKQCKCVIGVWKRSTKQIAVFIGSTVPNWSAVIKQHGKPNKLDESNMRPTGRYKHKVGTHKKEADPLYIASVFREDEEVPAIRTLNNAIYEITDIWTFGRPGDNIHPTRTTKTTDKFSSEGCITVLGEYTKAKDKTPDKHTGLWSDFRKAAGINPTTTDSKDKDLEFTFVLLTGREARLISSSKKKDLTRLRFGSEGDGVKSIQLALSTILKNNSETEVYYDGKQTGKIDSKTIEAYYNWQKDKKGFADGIITPADGENLGWDLLGLTFTKRKNTNRFKVESITKSTKTSVGKSLGETHYTAKAGTHYNVQADILVTASLETKMEELAKKVYDDTKPNHKITYSSGYRGPDRQAKAMYDNIVKNGIKDLDKYKATDLADEVKKAYNDNKDKGETETVKKMTEVLEAQVAKGKYISRHMRSGAVDVSSGDKSYYDKIRKFVKEMGGDDPLDEGDHLHIQF